jgi:Probable zinc-ribbon domain
VSTYQDKELTCADCGKKFLWSAKDQEFFAERGFNEPKRCKDCRQAKKAQRGDHDRGGGGNR